MAGLVALLLALSGCSGIGDPTQTKACRALADQAPGIPGVAAATFTDAIAGGLPICTGDVTLTEGLSTAERGRVVGATYDVIRARAVKEVEFSTRFTLSPGTLTVASGIPTAEQATRVLEIAGSAHADSVEIAYSSPDLLATLHAPLSSTKPGGSLREGVALLRTQPPSGFAELDWYLGDDVLVAPTLTPDQTARLDALASWFDEHAVVTSYRLKIQAGVQAWTLVTSQEAPGVVRDFGAAARSGAAGSGTTGSGTTVTVSAALRDKPPYLTLP